jgi:hypothetical protein
MANHALPELTPVHVAILERLRDRGCDFVAFPMYASCVGVRKGNCVVLLAPLESDGFRLFGTPGWLIGGQISVRVTRDGADWFVWKKQSIEATPERLAEIAAFADELRDCLAPNSGELKRD